MIEYLRIRAGSYAEEERVYEMHVEDGIVKFRVHGYIAASERELGAQMSIECIKQIESLHIERWKESYESPVDTGEGAYWEVEYKVEDQPAKKSFGWDAYPPEWDNLMQMITFFGNEFIVISANAKINEAIQYASKAHRGQMLDNSDIDFITHPLEVLNILTSMEAEPDVLIAGVLHDVIEYTDADIEDITLKFGKGVASIVAMLSEDKGLTWRYRKKQLIDRLPLAAKSEQMIILADLVSHLRRIYVQLAEQGDKVWAGYKHSREDLSWYFSEVQDQLEGIKFFESVQHVYWEMVDLYKDVFVIHLLDAQKGRMYQIGEGAQVYMMEKSMPVWKEIIHMGQPDQRESELADKILKMAESAKAGSKRIQLISRIECQRIEDMWLAPVWKTADALQ